MSDYISKSALLKHLWDWRLQECPVGVCDEETETYKTICECIDAVKEQPTVDEKEIIRKTMQRVAERVHDITKIYLNGKRPEESAYVVRKMDVINILKEEGGIE